MDFLKCYHLNETHHRMDWFVAFMPQTPDNNNEDPALAIIKGDRTTKLAISDWTAYLNAKAMLNNAGQKGHIFANKCKPFTNADIFQMFGLYIIDGIAPSPQLQQKMQPQSKQPTHGNDKNTSVIGTGSQQKYHSFWHFFTCQDPLTMPLRLMSSSVGCCVTSRRRCGVCHKNSLTTFVVRRRRFGGKVGEGAPLPMYFYGNEAFSTLTFSSSKNMGEKRHHSTSIRAALNFKHSTAQNFALYGRRKPLFAQIVLRRFYAERKVGATLYFCANFAHFVF